MKKNINYLLNLTFIYLILVLLIGIAIYALIKNFGIEDTLATNILIWSATLFPSIVIIYTFQSWRNQKASEILATEAKVLAEMMRDQQDLHRNLITSHKFSEKFENSLVQIKEEFNLLSRKLNFLESIISNVYNKDDLVLFTNTKNTFQCKFHSYWEDNKIKNLANTYPGSWVDDMNVELIKNSIDQINEDFSNAHLDMYELLIQIMLHSESLSKRN